jgi:hypothetical protein
MRGPAVDATALVTDVRKTIAPLKQIGVAISDRMTDTRA